MRPTPKPLGSGQLFFQKLQRTFPAKRSHRLAVAPGKVYFQFFIQFLHIRELLPIVKVPLVIPVPALYFAVVPRCTGQDQLKGNTCRFQRNIKGTFFCVTDVFVGEFRTIVCLDCLNLKWKRFLKHFEEFYGVFRGMFLRSIDKPYSGTFVDSCPLVQVLSIPFCSSF